MLHFLYKHKKIIFRGLMLYYYPPSITYIFIEGIKYVIDKKIN